jgi:hypothetical protein
MVGAVGVEFAVHLISPADSIALALFCPSKCSSGGEGFCGKVWPLSQAYFCDANPDRDLNDRA